MKTNDKVVCVDDTPARNPNSTVYGKKLLIRGQVYCVEALEFTPRNKTPMLFVSGVEKGWHRSYGIPWGWDVARFRLVSEVGHPPIAIEQPQPLHA